MHLPLLWLGLALFAFALLAPIRRLGDAADYVMATESLLYDHDLLYAPGDLARHLARKPIDFDSPAGLHTRIGAGGRTYLGAHHSFYYSLAALPFYAAFGYRGFLLFNALALWLFAWCLHRHLLTWNGPAAAWAWLLMALVFSASWTYVAWIHTEVFYMLLVGLFVYAWRNGHVLWASAALGVVAAAQPALCLLGLPFFVLAWLEHRRPGLLLAMAGIVLAAAAPQVLFNLYAFGAVHPFLLEPSLLGGHFMGLARFLRSWFDPAGGVVWFYPAVLVALLETPWNRRSVALWLAALAVIAACGASAAWYSHQVGLRYGAYVFGLVVFLVEKVRFDRLATAALWSFAVLVGTGLAVDPLGNSARLGIQNKLFLPYRVAAALDYPEEGNVLWTRLEHLNEFVGVAPVWQDGWIPGGTEITFVTSVPADGPLRLVVSTWPLAGRPQHLEVETATGRYRYELAPAGNRTVDVPLHRGDLLRGTAPPEGVVHLRLRAEAWVPCLVVAKSADVRRLGIALQSVSIHNIPLYQNTGSLTIPALLLPQ